ncbi:hypothetical protein ACFPIJ_13945 [Dactylosporangium cerinum]|uniref:Transposase n=1 Tax=Dactylosporangium cerinum TaxID=1434730 RepID=A0ABV9VRL5_9ACTN
MIGHAPRHREPGHTAKVLRKVRWLRVTHPRPSTTITLDLDLDPACRTAALSSTAVAP